MSSVGNDGPADPGLPLGPGERPGAGPASGQEASDDLLAAIQEGYFRLDDQGRLVQANQAAAAITGLGVEQMLGRTMAQVWPGWGQGPATSELIECLENNLNCVVVAMLPRQESAPRWIRLRVDPLAAGGARILALEVTAKVMAEQAQADSDFRYGALFSLTGQGVLHFDHEGRITEANPAAEAILGQSRRELLGRRSLDPDWQAVNENGAELPGHQRPTMRALATGQEVIGQVMGVYNPARGETRWLMINATPQFRPGEKTPFQVFVTLTDITELKRSRDETRLLAEFPRQNPYPVLRVDAEGRLVYANAAAEALTECWGSAVGAKLPEDKARLVARALATGRVEPLEEQCPARTYALSLAPLPEISMVHVYGLDITELKQAQQALAWQLEVRTVLSEFSRALIASPPQDIAALALRVLGQARTLTGSEHGYVGSVDPKTGVMTAHTFSESAVGQCRMADGLDSIAFKPDADGRYPALWGHALNTRQGFFTNAPQGHPAARGLPAGHMPVTRFLSVPVPLGEELVGQIALANPPRDYSQRDLTAVSQLAEVFGLALQRLLAQEGQRKVEEQLRQAQKMEALGALAGGIAHDFNNLLQAMRGYVQLAQYDEGIKPETSAQLKAVDAAVGRASEMVRRILTFSRRVEPQKQPLNLNDLVGQEVKLLERTLPKMIALQTALAPDLRRVDADPVQMEQVILNLAGNARDAMAGAGRLVIETSNVILDEEFSRAHHGLKPGPHVWLRVSDNGRGMDAATIKQVFEPFFTTKRPGEGTGLGLATVYGIIKSHGGHVAVYSEPGVGTTFNIYLPARDDAVQAPPAEAPSQEIKGGHETILLVDDEASILDAGRRLLKRSGYSVITALNGEEALDIYARRQDEIALVVMDLGMPGMGGYRTLVEMRRRFPAIKVVVASGYAPQAQGQDVMQAGAVAFLHKPYQLPDLLRTVRQALDCPAPAPPEAPLA
ncbi:MAG: PAS domain-containing protein [Thermodesulfobacteriota bacterium]